LLDLAALREDVQLVGGAARDLLLGRIPRELDLVVGADAPSVARDLASKLGLSSGEVADRRFGVETHERFGTALVWWEGGRIDIAQRRAESYPGPGALPEVRPGTTEEDLLRRDFTVNAIAVLLGGPQRGELSTAPAALDDLMAARLRVLHEGSFLDDPTRLFRLGRYRARLGFEVEGHTAELAVQALANGALETVSMARVGAELRLALAEPDPVTAIAVLSDLGILSALDPRLRFDEPLSRGALSMLPADGRADLLLLAGLLLDMTDDREEDPERAIFGLLDELEFTAADRARTTKTALSGPLLADRLEAVTAASELPDAIRPSPLEGVALAGALAEQEGLARAPATARRWLTELRHVRLTITGDDLLAAGVPAGPEIGRRLELALRRKLDGELTEGREAELAAAMEGP
jgi:tRNA nucleotidyltransferase (CCA-adding enzyme)